MRSECPHCRGDLVKVKDFVETQGQYHCTRCGRGWKVDEKGNWHALFDAGMHVYDSKGELIEALGRRVGRRR
jgi:transposase-like protein